MSEELMKDIEETTETAEVTESMQDYADQLERSMRKISVGDILEGIVLSVDEEEVVLDLQYYTEGVIKAEDYSDDPSVTAMDEVKIGQELSATVVRMDDGNGRILLSRKAANSVLAWDRLDELKEAEATITVKISDVSKGGATAYVEGIRGFIPASRLALSYVEEEEMETYKGRKMAVRVIETDREKSRVILSAREILQAERDEQMRSKVSNMEVGLVTEGVVESLQDYGAFVKLNNGVSGLVHISQICIKRIKHPSVMLEVGQTVKVKIIAIKDGKISLSMKALEEITATEITEEAVEIPQTEAIGTSLGDLLKNFKFD